MSAKDGTGTGTKPKKTAARDSGVGGVEREETPQEKAVRLEREARRAAAEAERARAQATAGEIEVLEEEAQEGAGAGAGGEERRRAEEDARRREERRRAEQAQRRAQAGAQRGAQEGAVGGGDRRAPPPPAGGNNPPNEDRQERRMANGATINANQLAILGDFKGEEDEDIEIFIGKVELLVQSFNWTPEITASMVQTRLKGNAATWLHSQTKRRNPELRTWYRVQEEGGVAVQVGGMRELLRVRFKEALNERGAVDAVMDLKQKKNETVDEFHDRVSLAIDRKNFLYTEAEKATAEYQRKLAQDIYTFFAAGLHEDIAQQALGGPTPPTDEEGLLRAARNAELERKKNKKPKYLSALDTEEAEAATTAEQPTQVELSALQAEIEELRKQLTGGGRKWRCFICDGPHLQYDCPQRQRRQQQRDVDAYERKRSTSKYKTSSTSSSTRKTTSNKKKKRDPRQARVRIGGRVRRVFILDEESDEEEDIDQADIGADDDGDESDDDGIETIEISPEDWRWIPNA